jgi:TATA-binding protein-associated factor Taf7
LIHLLPVNAQTEAASRAAAENGREGVLNVAGQPYPVRVLDLPTIVESYKTYDDINLVKTGDVGQVRQPAGVLQVGFSKLANCFCMTPGF